MAMARAWAGPWAGTTWPRVGGGWARLPHRPRRAGWSRWVAGALLAIHAGDPPGRTSDGDRAQVGQTGQAARQGEFEAFFRRHERDIFSYLWRLTSNEASAYDLTQETFLRAWQHFDKVAGYERPGGWLFRVATNLALNHLRASRSPLGAAATLDERDRMSDDPARGVVESDQVRRALMALGARTRAALVLREVYGLTGAELAATLGITEGAAKTLLWRARDEFRARYLGDAGNSGAFRTFRQGGPQGGQR